MAKIPFSKLSLKKKEDIKTIVVNEQTIEVKQYLPINEKTDLITRIIQNSYNSEVNYYNPILLEVLTTLELVMAYSNINFTDKQKEDTAKLYDLLESNDVTNQIIAAIPETEYKFIVESIDESIKSIYTYQQSALGILSSISQDYSNVNYDMDKIQDVLGNKESLKLLREVLTKLG